VSALHNHHLGPRERARSGFTAQAVTRNIPASSLELRSGTIPHSDISAEANVVPICIVIPAFNEEAGVAYVIEQLKQVARERKLSLEILVVDDGSTDGTAVVAQRAGAHVIKHGKRKGYGAALNTGLIAARAKIIVITDADGTYPAQSLPALISALDNAEMAVALRPRFSANGTFLRSLIKIPLIWLSNYIAGTCIPDLNSGMRAFRRDTVLRYLAILPNTFSWTTTITLSLLCDKLSIIYVPVAYGRRVGRSKFGIRHAALLPFLLVRIALLFAPLKVFIPLVGILLACGTAQSAIDLIAAKWVSPAALLAFTMAGLLAVVAGLAQTNSTFIRVRASR
jgi:Glycosyl transferase family 2